MKSLKKVGFLSGVLAMTLIGCQKEKMEQDLVLETNENKQIVYNYSYQNMDFTVQFEVDKEYRPLSASGDLKEFAAVFNGSAEEMPRVYLVEQADCNNSAYDIRIFDTSEEMDQYQERTQEVTLPQQEDDRFWWCTTWNSTGDADFRFYRDINYGNEITSIRELNVSYFQRSSLAHPAENDAISSFLLDGPASLDLFRHGCFGLTQIRFTESIDNLHEIFTISADDAELRGEQFWWHPSTGAITNYNFGDETSSMKGWSL